MLQVIKERKEMTRFIDTSCAFSRVMRMCNTHFGVLIAYLPKEGDG